MANDHGPITPEYHQAMNDLAHDLDAAFNGELKGENRKTGFILLVFPFNDGGGRINYISNCDRESGLIAMREFLARHSGMQMPVSKAAQ